jgi:hypothetical protein
MNATTMTVMVMAHLRPAEIGGGSAAGGVTSGRPASWRRHEAGRRSRGTANSR